MMLKINPVYSLSLETRIKEYPNQWENKLSLPSPKNDLYFPFWFQGKWEVNSILTEQIAPLAPDFVTPGFKKNFAYLNQEIKFKVQFISSNFKAKINNFIPSNIKSKSVIIADRKFNAMEITKAYLGDNKAKNIIINQNNYNEQITRFSEGNELISKVIGRQQETVSPTEFITSELTRQFFRGINNVYLNLVETTTKYEFINDNNIKAQQITAIYLSPEDPNFFIAINKPVALYFYSLNLTKLN